MGDTSCVLSFPWFPLPEAIDGVDKIRDFSGYGNHGTPVNFAAASDVEFVQNNSWGQSLSLTNPKHLNCGNILDYTVQDFSFEYIFLATSIVGSPVLAWKGYAVVSGYYIQIGAAGNIGLITSQVGVLQTNRSANGSILIGQRYHVIITRTGPTVLIYINGNDATAVSVACINPVSSNENFLVSTYGGPGNGLNGELYQVRAWTRTLGAAEILNRYKNRHRLTD